MLTTSVNVDGLPSPRHIVNRGIKYDGARSSRPRKTSTENLRSRLDIAKNRMSQLSPLLRKQAISNGTVVNTSVTITNTGRTCNDSSDYVFSP